MEESGKWHTQETLGELGGSDIRNRWTGGGKRIIMISDIIFGYTVYFEGSSEAFNE